MKLSPNEIPGLATRRKPAPEKDHHGEMMKVLHDLIAELAKQRETVVQVTPEIQVNVPAAKPVKAEPIPPMTWTFTVERDSRGLIQTIKATNG